MIHPYNIYYFIDEFNSDELTKLDKKINIIYRNYNKENNYNEIIEVIKFCKFYNRKIYISNHLKFAMKYDSDGLYIPSFNKKLNFKNFSKRRKFRIIGSAHNIEEIKIKEKQGCEEIFISPLFMNKKNSNFLGVTKFYNLSKFTKKKIIALGGINEKNLKLLRCLNISGFAAINWIKKNRPVITGRFN